MKLVLKNFWHRTSGATAIEYALIASLISLALFSGLSNYYNALNETYNIVISNFTAH